jgi:hypothetical protein
VSASRVRQIVRRAKAAETFELYIEDGTHRIPVAQVRTSRGFLHSCLLAKRKYSGLFASLELPSWRLTAGNNSILVNAAELNGGA